MWAGSGLYGSFVLRSEHDGFNTFMQSKDFLASVTSTILSTEKPAPTREPRKLPRSLESRSLLWLVNKSQTSCPHGDTLAVTRVCRSVLRPGEGHRDSGLHPVPLHRLAV